MRLFPHHSHGKLTEIEAQAVRAAIASGLRLKKNEIFMRSHFDGYLWGVQTMVWALASSKERARGIRVQNRVLAILSKINQRKLGQKD